MTLTWGQQDRHKLIYELGNALYKHLSMSALKLASQEKPLSKVLLETEPWVETGLITSVA